MPTKAVPPCVPAQEPAVKPVEMHPEGHVPVIAAKPTAVVDDHLHLETVAQPSKPTWHHHHHHQHPATVPTMQPIIGTTVQTGIVPHATTPVAHVDVNAAFPVEAAKPAVAPVVINPVTRPHPTAPANPLPPVAPAAGTCCNQGISLYAR